MTIHTKYATYIFQEAYNECYLVTKTHDKLVEGSKGGENTMVLGKPYECMCVLRRRVGHEEIIRLFLSDRVVTTSPMLTVLGMKEGNKL